MFVWMLYVTCVSVLLGAAALAAEHQARARRAPSRWFWVLAIVASLLLPTAMTFVSFRIPSAFGPAAPHGSFVLREVTSARLSAQAWIGADAMHAPKLRYLDPLLRRTWITASVVMLTALILSGAQLLWRMRRWAPAVVAGTPVLSAPEVGPAVVGLLRPRIVVPAWLTESPLPQQRIVIAHELSHLDAGDPQLLTVALCLLVFMPWNLPLWWQLHRLRRAIEVDCDGRVLRRGLDAAVYGETLIAVGERQSGFVGAVAGMSESKSFLEKRIRIMLSPPNKWRRLAAAAFGALAVGLIAAAAEVSPPDPAGSPAAGSPGAGSPGVAHTPIELPSSVLDGYTGSFQLSESLIITVSRKGEQLFAQLTGQPSVEIYPESRTQFFYRVVDAQITFKPDAQGRAMALVLHQHGAAMPASRVDAAFAERAEAGLTAKIRAQVPTAGSEAALRRLVDGQMKGSPNYSEMSPALASAVREQLPRIESMLKGLGALQSVEFRGVGAQGWDLYEVRFQNGVLQYRIALSADGMIAGALMTAGP